MKRILIFLTLLTFVAGLLRAAEWHFTIETTNNTSIADDAYIVSNQATTNYGTATVLYFGDNYNIQRVLSRWQSLSDTFALGGGTTYPEGDVDSIIAEYTLSGVLPSNSKSFRWFALTLKRDWVESEATYNIFSTGNNWETAGATGSADVYLDSLASTLVDSAATGQFKKIRVKLNPDNFGSSHESILLNYFDVQGGSPCALGIYATDHTNAAAIGQKLYVYGGGGTTSPDTLISHDIDSLLNDHSGEYDSALIWYVTSDEDWPDSVIITAGLSQPDSTGVGFRWARAYEASSADTILAMVGDVVEPDWLYFSFWVKYNDGPLWSTRQKDSIYYDDPAADTGPPDDYSLFSALMVLNLDPDSVRLAVGAVDSADAERTIIRWDTAAIPSDTTEGFSLYAGALIEDDTSDYSLVMAQPNWVYFSIFALDEVGNASSVVSDSIYFPGGGAGGEATGRTNRMFEFLISRQEKMTR